MTTMRLNDYWRGVIEAGPIEPPLNTVAYRMADMQFGMWEVEWALADALRPTLERVAAELRAAFR